MEIINPAIGSLQINEDDVMSHSTDIFSSVSKEVSMIDGVSIAYRPTSLTNNGPYTFIINSQGNQFLQRNSARFWIRAKITKADGTDIGDDAEIAPVCGFAGSFIDKIDVMLDNVEISGLSNVHMNLKYYIETMLSYSSSTKKTHIRASGFYLDEANKFDTASDENSGFKIRKTHSKKSIIFESMCPIHADFLQSDRLFPPGMGLSLVLSRAPDSFLIHANDQGNYKIQIIDMKIYMRHVSLTDAATLGILSQLPTTPISLPYTKTIIKKIVCNSGITSINVPSMITGSLPRSLILCLRREGIEKLYTMNPYNFKPFGMTGMFVKVNGKQYPTDPYDVDFSTPTGAMRLYRDLYDNIGIQHYDSAALVTPELFRHNAFFMAFDLTPDLCHGIHTHMRKTGNIDIEMNFNPALQSPIDIICFASYDCMLHISPKKECDVIY
jgi:hypothetical protein